MALLTRTVLACNKCKREFVNRTSNVSVKGDDFFLCDTCIEKLLNFMSGPEDSQSLPTSGRFRSDNNKWDDYAIMRLVEMRMSGVSLTDIANELKLSRNSVYNIVHRIRHAQPGTELYKYMKYFGGEEYGD